MILSFADFIMRGTSSPGNTLKYKIKIPQNKAGVKYSNMGLRPLGSNDFFIGIHIQ